MLHSQSLGGVGMDGLGALMHRYRMARRFVRKSTRGLFERLERAWCSFRKSHRYFPPKAEESTGAYGERLAIEYLRRSGYMILERSYACPMGEIDIVAAWKSSMVVFVEVKTWSCQRENQGGPSDAVDEVKQRKICRSALHYAKRHGLLDTQGRLDVIEVVLGTEPCRPIFRHIEAAFESRETFQMHA
ncbi:MAG: YraN family protein [Planctomycetota bacterium]|nr:YraN family protein [Planctomycetota bacterium]